MQKAHSLFIISFLFLSSTFVSWKSIAPILLSDTQNRIADIAYYFVLVKSYWSNHNTHIYDIGTQKKIVEEYCHCFISHWGPNNATPSILIFFFPFAAVWDFSPSFALSSWFGFSFTFLTFVLLLIAKELPRRNQLLVVLYCGIIFFSPQMLSALFTGQTSLLHTAALLLIICYAQSSSEKTTPLTLLFIVALLACSLKPQIFAMSVGILLIFHQYRVLAYLLLSLIIAWFLMTPSLGSDWFWDYINTLFFYPRAELPFRYTTWAHFERMNIFSNAFAPMLGVKAASLLAVIFLLSSFLGSLLYGVFSSTTSAKNTATTGLFISYFLFSPFLASYEEILFAVPFVHYAQQKKIHNVIFYDLLFFIALVALLHGETLLPGKEGISFLMWSLKGFLFLLVFLRSYSQEQKE